MVSLFFSEFLILVLSVMNGVHGAPTSCHNTPNSVGIAKRALQTPFSGLPACNTQQTDPTWAVGKSKYKDGEGKNIGNDCDNNAWTTGNCLTEYFLVGTTQAYGGWTEPVGEENCGNGTGSIGSSSMCMQSLATMKQQCTSFEISASESIKSDFNAIIADVGLTLTMTQAWGTQSCTANTSTNTCTWSNQPGCHTAHVAPLIYTVHGYKRRSCASPTDDPNANMPNTSQRPDGLFTRGMQDFAVPIVQTNFVDCNATCGIFAKPLPAPNCGKMIPWPASGITLAQE